MSPVIRRIHCRNCSRPIHPNAQCTCGQTHGVSRRRSRGYSSKAWRDLRAEAIRRQPWCDICGSRDDLTGDHLQYPANALSHVRVLCRSCNGRDAQARQEGHTGVGK